MTRVRQVPCPAASHIWQGRLRCRPGLMACLLVLAGTWVATSMAQGKTGGKSANKPVIEESKTVASAPINPGPFVLSFSDLAGWLDDDHLSAYQAFRHTCEKAIAKPPKTGLLGVEGAALAATCQTMLELPAPKTARDARMQFEAHFTPVLYNPAAQSGFLTGYFEPEVPGSLVRTERFSVPLFKKPDDLVKITDANRPASWPEGLRFARARDGKLDTYPDRKAIETGYLAGKGLELVWLESWPEAFFIHIQGSARIRLADNSAMRVTFAAKSGHDYTPIGRVLIEKKLMKREDMTADNLRQWLDNNPDQAREIMWANRSFIFFQTVEGLDETLGPLAAAEVPLTPDRSLAVDRVLHTFGMPIWVDATLPLKAKKGEPAKAGDQHIQRLMIAQDTGSAIQGPERGDYFVGSGLAAGYVAGLLQHRANMVFLVPRTTLDPAIAAMKRHIAKATPAVQAGEKPSGDSQ